jgi:hypothetical protein
MPNARICAGYSVGVGTERIHCGTGNDMHDV